eukprot:scaffold274_cov144-Skeletonema_menzelii.AAC.28
MSCGPILLEAVTSSYSSPSSLALLPWFLSLHYDAEVTIATAGAASIKKLHADTGLGHDDAIKTLMRGFKVRLVAKDVLAEAAELAR